MGCMESSNNSGFEISIEKARVGNGQVFMDNGEECGVEVKLTEVVLNNDEDLDQDLVIRTRKNDIKPLNKQSIEDLAAGISKNAILKLGQRGGEKDEENIMIDNRGLRKSIKHEVRRNSKIVNS